MNLKEILQDPPNAHRDSNGNFYSMGITGELLNFIANHIDSNSNTLETGCGVSTVVFAAAQTKHICITPMKGEIQQVEEYLRSHQISADKLTFACDISERVLPNLNCDPLDLVLIDGRHGFPAPFIDFYYTASKLKKSGLLVIDDTWLWTGEVLKQLLVREPEWQMEADFSPRSCVFRKLEDGSELKEWGDQAFIVANSRFKIKDNSPSNVRSALRYIKRGEFSVLGHKIAKKLRTPWSNGGTVR